jgi:methylenetetrahydrofolate--tRNA-(uracil-5-)-methyltransferase
LAVDRELFAGSWYSHINLKYRFHTKKLTVTVGRWIIATGPLTSGKLATTIATEVALKHWHFRRNRAILYHDSIGTDQSLDAIAL